MKTIEDFRAATGEDPWQDDMERVNCPKAGETAHLMCGWCVEHDKPRFWCGCFAPYRREVNQPGEGNT